LLEREKTGFLGISFAFYGIKVLGKLAGTKKKLKISIDKEEEDKKSNFTCKIGQNVALFRSFIT